jgi:hypothetical protein
MDVNGMLCCCGCPITPVAPEDWLNDIYDGVEESYFAQSTEEMLAHLQLHSEHGDSFPSDIIPALIRDDRKNFPVGDEQ